ncbi:MAG TPA: hypothetical protein VFV50_16170, partial [Bdellovibrionales bacterium]|nr:hypothetical protein [Bdellovibrionales bacterium]
MLRVTTIIQTAVLAGALVACGKSNPTEDLNLKTVPRQSDARPANKTERAALKFEIVGGVAPDLIEGKPGVVQLRVKADTFVSAYELTPVELPEGAELKRVDFENWELRWTPRNVVPAGQDAVTVQVTVEVSVVEVKDQRELPKPLRPEPIRLNVVKSAQKPVLVASQLERDTVRAGEFLPFTLTVRDSASNGSIAPKIEVLRSKAPDNKDKADGVPFVTMAAAPERLSDGNWRYTLVFDTREKQIPSVKKRGQVDESAEEVTACFDVRFQSQSKLSSAESPMCIRILHRAAKPELKWDEANAVVQVGKANTLNFSVTAPSSRGRL